MATQINIIRMTRDAEIADVKELAARKMTRIRKLRDKQIKEIQEKAFTQIKEVSAKTNPVVTAKKTTKDSPKQKSSQLKRRVVRKRMSRAKQ